MIVTTGVHEAPVLEALFKMKPRPRADDALRALRDERVREAAVAVAERMRHLAMEEDVRRTEVGTQGEVVIIHAKSAAQCRALFFNASCQLIASLRVSRP